MGRPSEFQDDERDIIFLSAVHSTDKTLAPQTKPADQKQWNVALTRARKKLVFVVSHEMKHLKKLDVRRSVYEGFHDAVTKTKTAQKLPAISANFKIEGMLISEVRSLGFAVVRNEGRIWSSALRLSHQASPNSALVMLENAGEPKSKWKKAVDEQLSLEGAGRSWKGLFARQLLVSGFEL